MSRTAEGVFDGAGGVPIFWQSSGPDVPPRGVVLLAHGYAEHLGRYREWVAHMNGRGYAVAAIDHRGHGRSGGPRGHCLDFAELVFDLRRLSEHAGRWWPDVPRALFGHSMGGLIAYLYLLRHPDTVRCGALSAPALRVRPEASGSLFQIALLLGRIAPRLPLPTGLDQGALSRDPAVGAAYVADPLVHRRATAGFLRAVAAAQAIVHAEADRIAVPLMVIQGDADRLVDAEAVRELGPRLRPPHEVVMLPGYYHELLNEPVAERAKVVELLDRWFDRWLASPA
jgi:alpha-beta hydrolase superfamily lysophospholipase